MPWLSVMRIRLRARSSNGRVISATHVCVGANGCSLCVRRTTMMSSQSNRVVNTLATGSHSICGNFRVSSDTVAFDRCRQRHPTGRERTTPVASSHAIDQTPTIGDQCADDAIRIACIIPKAACRHVQDKDIYRTRVRYTVQPALQRISIYVANCSQPMDGRIFLP